MFCVYKHTCPNGKVYIGITSKSVNKRWQNGFGYRTNKHFSRAIEKYGWENINHEILFDGLTKEEAEQKEIELIALYKSNQSAYGYNRSTGGECHAKGCKWSAEHKEKTSKALTGHFVSEESREKIKIARKIQKVIVNPPILKGQKNPKAREVVQIDKKGNIVNTFRTVKEAAAFNKVCHQSISDCCRRKLKSVKGFIFQYA